MDLELELRTAMLEASDDIVADPFLLSRLPTPRRHRPWVALVAVAAGVALVASVGVYVGGVANRPATGQVATSAGWGQTRGDLAGDEAFLAAVRAEWVAPDKPAHALENPKGPVRVLWAGTTPDGPAAVVAQHDDGEIGRLVIRPVLPGPRLLTSRFQEMLPGSAGEDGAIVFSTATSTVVVPEDPQTTVRISTKHSRGADGRVIREFSDLPVRHGAAIARSRGGDVLVEVRLGSSVLFRHADFTSPGPRPRNLLSGFCPGLCRAEVRPDGELSADHEGAFASAVGASDEWVRRGDWNATATTSDRSMAFAQQLYLPNEPAHTVVTFAAAGATTATVLYDVVTDVADRPVFVVRLPGGRGWFVGVGPGETISRWRVPGDRLWSDLATPGPVALLPTDARGVELGLADGTSQVIQT